MIITLQFIITTNELTHTIKLFKKKKINNIMINHHGYIFMINKYYIPC